MWNMPQACVELQRTPRSHIPHSAPGELTGTTFEAQSSSRGRGLAVIQALGLFVRGTFWHRLKPQAKAQGKPHRRPQGSSQAGRACRKKNGVWTDLIGQRMAANENWHPVLSDHRHGDSTGCALSVSRLLQVALGSPHAPSTRATPSRTLQHPLTSTTARGALQPLKAHDKRPELHPRVFTAVQVCGAWRRRGWVWRSGPGVCEGSGAPDTAWGGHVVFPQLQAFGVRTGHWSQGGIFWNPRSNLPRRPHSNAIFGWECPWDVLQTRVAYGRFGAVTVGYKCRWQWGVGEQKAGRVAGSAARGACGALPLVKRIPGVKPCEGCETLGCLLRFLCSSLPPPELRTAAESGIVRRGLVPGNVRSRKHHVPAATALLIPCIWGRGSVGLAGRGRGVAQCALPSSEETSPRQPDGPRPISPAHSRSMCKSHTRTEIRGLDTFTVLGMTACEDGSGCPRTGFLGFLWLHPK